MDGSTVGAWGTGLQAASTARAKGPRGDQPALHLWTTARRPLQEGVWPEGTLSPCSQGWRPRGRAWARLEEMGPGPRRADSPGTANIPSAGDETQSQ